MNEIFQTILFSIGERQFTAGEISMAVLSVLLSFIVYKIFLTRLIPLYFAKEKIKIWGEERVSGIFRTIFILIAVIAVIWSLKLDLVLYSAETLSFAFRLTTIFEAVLIFQIARLFDWILSKVLLYNYYQSRDTGVKVEGKYLERKPIEKTGSRTVQYVVYVLSAILILKMFRLESFFRLGEHTINLTNIFWALLVVLVAQLLVWIFTQLILYRYYKINEVNVGSQYAINQLLKYVLYIFAIFMAMEIVGINLTVLWGGAAALLVGLGLGLQQTFNDLFSGIILLFEGKVEVGNIIEINDGMVGTVKLIGLRTSIVETLDHISVVVPNSKLITENVTHWSHADDKARFTIDVGVAYGSDTQLVKDLLLKVAKNNVYVLKAPGPSVRFANFGDSALDFKLIFWSRNFIIIDDVKSDLRFEIDQIFRDNKISIPFPQRDVWMRK